MHKKSMVFLFACLFPCALAASPQLKLPMAPPVDAAPVVDGKQFFPLARAATRPAGEVARQPVMQAKVGDYMHPVIAPRTQPGPSQPAAGVPDALQAGTFRDIFDAE